MTAPTSYDVAIIGCGPVGALAANLCGKAGLRTLVVERESDPHPLPRAVHLDHEMMRLFQGAGVIDRVLPDMRDTDGHLHIGADGGVIRYLGTAGQPRPFGWSNDYFFYQPELEAHLREALAAHRNVELRLGTSFVGLEQDAAGVTLDLDREGTRCQARARWVIACDGSRSPVRKALGIALDDLGFDEPWLVVDAEVEGPIRFPDVGGVPEGADLQRLSVMLCDPRRPATIVPGRGDHRRWEFMLLPGEDEAEMTSPERLAELVGPWVDGTPHRIVRAATYRFHALIAEHWQRGRVFLAGDAAHQTPPFFGQGMCHGLRDVANLVWKIALVKRGVAAPALLASYQPERDPHVRAVIAAAVEAGRYICQLDPALAAARDAEMRQRDPNGARTAGDLIPPLAAGVVARGTAGAGERFVQPLVLKDGAQVPLDMVTGGGWRLFAADAETAAQAERVVMGVLPEIGIRVIDASALADGGALAAWLAGRGATAVIVRPDSYVFGTAEAAPGDLVVALAGRLHRVVPQARERVA